MQKESIRKKPKQSADLLSYEQALREEGYTLFCGVDEAGRGPLAGPVCAAAVILPAGWVPEGLNDSKKLTEKQRERLFPIIQEGALDFGIAFADVDEIETLNILGATFLAMNRAIGSLRTVPPLALIDGNRNNAIRYESRCVVGGDGKCASIAAASVLAKVSRDRLMQEYAARYPQYGFEKHKGYGTKAHYEALRQYGPCPIHRMSFLPADMRQQA